MLTVASFSRALLLVALLAGCLPSVALGAPPPLPEGVPDWPYAETEGLTYAEEAPLVFEALYSSDPALRRSGALCARILAGEWTRFKGDRAAPPWVCGRLAAALDPRLSDEDATVRWETAQAMWVLGRRRRVVSVVSDLLLETDGEFRREITCWVAQQMKDAPYEATEFFDVMDTLSADNFRDNGNPDLAVATYMGRMAIQLPSDHNVHRLAVDSAEYLSRRATPAECNAMVAGWPEVWSARSEIREALLHVLCRPEANPHCLTEPLDEQVRLSIPLYEELLARSESLGVRREAANRLLRLHPPAVDAVRSAFAEDEPGVLRAIPPHSWRLVRDLLPSDRLRVALHQTESEVRLAAAVLLCCASDEAPEEAISALLDALQASSADGAPIDTGRIMAAAGPALTPALLEWLATGEPHQRAAAARALRGQRVECLADRLVAGLDCEDVEVRVACAESLRYAAPDQCWAILGPVIAEDPNRSVRAAAVRSLAVTAGRGDEEALRLLCNVVKAPPRSDVRLEAILALAPRYRGHWAESHQPASALAEALAEALQDESPQVVAEAANLLGALGRAAEPFTDALVPLLDDERVVETQSRDEWGSARRMRTVGHCAAAALVCIQPPREDAARVLVRDLTDPDPEVRKHGYFRIGDLGPAAFPALLPLLDHPDTETRARAARLIGPTGPAGLAARDKLLEMMHDTDPSVREAAIDAMEGLGAANLGVVTELRAALHDPEPRVASSALYALRRPDRPIDEAPGRMLW